MVTVKCLYCDADNDPRATGGFCDACGKRLPLASSFRSRRLAVGAAGEDAAPEATVGPRSPTSEALFLIAVLQLVAGGMFLVLAPVFFSRMPDNYLQALILMSAPPVFVFAILGVLARRWPVPATVLAMILQVVWTGAGFALNAGMALYWLPASLGVLALLVWPLVVSQKRK
jgi:hypothetical protein